VVGTYHNVGLFLDRLLHFPRIFNVDNISIKTIPNQTAETTIQAHITAKTYFFMTEAGAPAAKSPQAGR
jgi:Tfp pilus assembly protein PilO